MKTIIRPLGFFLLLLISPSLYAMTGTEAVAKFQSRMYKAGSFSGIISWTRPNGATTTGAFKYMAPGRIYIKFKIGRAHV